MRRILVLVLLTACGEAREALVGIVPVDKREPDATPQDTGVESSADDASTAPACVELPDLISAGLLGSLTKGDIVTTSVRPMACTDSNRSQPAYTFTRVDGAPIVRARRSYALYAPVIDYPPELTGVSGGHLFTAFDQCRGDEALASVDVPVMGKSCVEFHASEDATLLLLEDAALIGLGMVSFSLCEGSCP